MARRQRGFLIPLSPCYVLEYLYSYQVLDYIDAYWSIYARSLLYQCFIDTVVLHCTRQHRLDVTSCLKGKPLSRSVAHISDSVVHHAETIVDPENRISFAWVGDIIGLR